MSISMVNEELEMCIEEEKKKCLKNIQNFYRKYGCEKIEILQKYLETLCETLTNQEEIDEIKKQLTLLENYN